MNNLLSTEVSTLADAEVHDGLVGLRGEMDRLAAHHARLAGEWDARRLWADDGSKSAGHRLSRESGSGIAACKGALRRATALRSMPLVDEAFVSGLSADRVDVLVQTRKGVEVAFARDEQLLVAHALELSWPDFTKLCAYWRTLADAEATTDRHERQVQSRELFVSPILGGMVSINSLLDPVSGEIFLTTLGEIEQELFDADWAEARERLGDAATAGDLRRSAPQRRADALVEMATRAKTAPVGGKRPKPLFTVVLGGDEFRTTCEMASGQVVGPDQLVPQLTSCDIERMVFDGPSRVIDVGEQRNFSGALLRAIKARDKRCMDSSICDVPASKCQGDHIWPWSKDGRTIDINGQCLCPFHNRWKGDLLPEHLGLPPEAPPLLLTG